MWRPCAKKLRKEAERTREFLATTPKRYGSRGSKDKEVTRFEPKTLDNTHPSERMRQAIDSPKGRQLYSQRFGTVEPVFANIRHNKRLTRFNHRGRAKVNTQWNLYCMVHNIEKLSKTSLGQQRVQ